MRLLLAAYILDPGGGSEGALGWNRTWSLAQDHDVTVLTLDHPERRARIEQAIANEPSRRLTVDYVPQPPRGWRPPEPNPLMWFISNYQASKQYNGWAARASRRALELHSAKPFDLAHHVTFAGLYHGTCLSVLPQPVPLVMGPVGSGVSTHRIFHPYLEGQVYSERLRTLALKASLRFPSTNLRARRAATRSNLIICCNPETELLAKRLGARTTVLEWDSTLDESYFEEFPQARPTDYLEILWVGTLRPPKGLNLALDILAHLGHRIRWRLRILGDGPVKARIPAWIQERGIADRVEFVGRVPYTDLRRYYAESHSLLFSSFRDNGGNQLLESMALGCVPIALDQGGARLLISSGQNGYVVPIESIDQVLSSAAASLAQLFEEPGRFDAISAAAKARAWQYRSSTERPRMEAFYRQVKETQFS